ncbi:MAG: Holliday junction branch migration DNA helicase RuvB, partial [Thermodesulfobacteriota bacterium]|nr:Holliday junction branch migration DNA helicase RuvB [Thermodesulfobacteriota bacterium]
GLGKTTLANIIAHEMNVNINATAGPVIEKLGDLAGILTNLKEGDILFLDEIHRLNHLIEEKLYPSMEDFKFDFIIGQGPGARTVKFDLPKFTLVGATTRAGLLTSPLRGRFGIIFRIDYYKPEELEIIINRSAKILSIPIESDGLAEIAGRSRGTPRTANRLLRRVRDYAQVRADGIITKEVARGGLKLLDIDRLGLDLMDRKLLSTIIEKFNGGPVGIDSLAMAISEEKDTLEEVYEPYLLQEGFIQRTPRGRVATKLTYEHLGKNYNNTKQKSLF